jgi:pyridinium-3,5-bisthiocarboxylic acid mononucleotide nickel chelatase
MQLFNKKPRRRCKIDTQEEPVRVAHFDPFSGISGDMTLAALIDAGVDPEAIRAALASLGLPITLEIEKVRKGGFAATYVHVEAPEEHTHRGLREVEEILGRGKLSDRQRTLALKMFRRLAHAEATVHGMPLEKVHFHEVGALDSIADIAGAAVGLDLLGVERFTSGPVATGSGMVKCAHGLMPVPAPGTAELLKGVPLRSSSIKAELTTPTGAAILTSVVDEWIDSPAMTIDRIGHGAGRRELVEQPNLLRLMVGEAAEAHGPPSVGLQSDSIWVLETNLDDLPAEVVGYCYDRLFEAGALDVFSTPIFMKKNRPGILLSVLAPSERLAALEEILFRETTTLGIRRYVVERHKLNRKPATVSTPWGAVQGKLGWLDGRPPVFSPEYDDCARIARAQGIPLREVYACAERAYEQQKPV